MKYFFWALEGGFIAMVLVFLPASLAFGQWRGPGGWDMGPGMMGWGILAWFGPIMMLIFWVAIILAIIFFIRWLVVSPRGSRNLKSEGFPPWISLKKDMPGGRSAKRSLKKKRKT